MFDLDHLEYQDRIPDAIAAVLALDISDALFAEAVNDRALQLARIPADEAGDRLVHWHH